MSANTYNIIQEDYDHVDQSFHNSYDSVTEFAAILPSFVGELKPGSKLLNVGGTLAECRYFLQQGYQVTNIDISQVMLDHITQHEPGVEVLQHNISQQLGQTFDAIWACRSLIHIPPADIDLALRNLRSSLQLGGVLGVILFTTDQAKITEEKLPEQHTNKPGTVYYRVLYPTSIIKAKIQQAGFTITKTEPCQDKDGDKAVYIQAT